MGLYDKPPAGETSADALQVIKAIKNAINQAQRACHMATRLTNKNGREAMDAEWGDDADEVASALAALRTLVQTHKGTTPDELPAASAKPTRVGKKARK